MKTSHGLFQWTYEQYNDYLKILKMMKFYVCDAPPSSLMDSTRSPKVKITKGTIVGVRSLACNTLRVKGHARAPGWD
jgi:hypothetical protein